MPQEWPDNFKLSDDPAAAATIHTFVETELAALAQLDKERAEWVRDNLPDEYEMTYIFHEHARRVATDMKNTALHLGLGEHTAENLYWATLPHDCGKSRLPADLWDMMDKPEAEIKQQRRTHTDLGAQAAENALDTDHPIKDLMLDIIRNHHEHMDGSGFRGLRGDDLSAPVRLACIVESFDGYRIARPHFGDRDISVPGVLDRMRTEKAGLYDPELFEAFAAMKMQEISNAPAPPQTIGHSWKPSKN